ncbi:hypothetical protein ED92_23800 [Amycolatopsis sp. MJM2582]|uniref:ANTAR domain-containing protein n=1 Tax=Amycolatopsis keratiniphila subsp. keratiniphila TaxID=227715 RepID=A0A1W2LZU1_9PSEU|nr:MULTISPECIES: hypothetical protein [Amycolatopsis]KFZ80383.1 hypothetical protein ED92_23800 [Amycolatopsis sp. MJM2582]OLZ58956.1 hypothetical protein BS330_10040 [Amycolatopsis keratiniphila subsp. nogabecina]ONF72744.1 hypothetical protein AVR91_0210380 [Amycolatopsis keratiniphila subsp. keratiniphila]SDU69555.1 hypothetical protein SAMN04489733_8523 [Amycolatopsis keratiniphila]
MLVRSDSPPTADVIGLALEVLAAQGLRGEAARAALDAMARERGLPVKRCAALIVAAVDGRTG